jgi:branched-chain amino acid transport system permease protein
MSDASSPASRISAWPLLGGFALLAALPLFATNFYVTLASSALITAMFALALNVMAGSLGLVSLGHAAFFGAAAYTVYYLTPSGRGLSFLITLPAAILTATLVSLVIGAISLRTRSFFFLMVTLAFGQMVFFLFHDTKLGGGADGVFFTRPAFSAFGWEIRLDRRERGVATYYLNLVLLMAMFFGLRALLRTLFGRVVAGIRANEHRMRALGYDVYRYKLACFVLSGALSGVAGHMWAMQKGVVNPELASWHNSAEALLMILLGGLRSLHGPILGALAYTGIGEIADLLTERRKLVEGLIILVAVLLLPQGIAGIRLRRERRDG